MKLIYSTIKGTEIKRRKRTSEGRAKKVKYINKTLGLTQSDIKSNEMKAGKRPINIEFNVMLSIK